MSELSPEQTVPLRAASGWWHWGRLLRLPNLLTVPGDPLAGAMLASGRTGTGPDPVMVTGVCLGSLALYAGGLIDNDLVDLATDRRERPERPLACGGVQIATARAVRLLLLGGGVALLALTTGASQALVLALALLLGILTYNRAKARSPYVACVLMGGCRGMSLWLGAAAMGGVAFVGWPVLLAVLAWTLYVAAVTSIAAGETRRGVGNARLLPSLAGFALAIAALLLRLEPGWTRGALMLAGVLGGVQALRIGGRLGSDSEPARIQAGVGQWIQALLLWQGMACLAGPGQPWPALVLLLMYPVTGKLAKRFYAS